MSALTDRIAAALNEIGALRTVPVLGDAPWVNAPLDVVLEAVEAAVPASMKPSREAVVHMLFDQVPDNWDENDIGILADAILALPPGRSEAEVREEVAAEVLAAVDTYETEVKRATSAQGVGAAIAIQAGASLAIEVRRIAREGGRRS